MPTVFHVVVDAVVRHWKSLVAEGAGGDSIDIDVSQPASTTIRACGDGRRRTEEGHTWPKVKAECFYSDDGVVASTNLGWLQTAFNTLTGLFDRGGDEEECP